MLENNLTQQKSLTKSTKIQRSGLKDHKKDNYLQYMNRNKKAKCCLVPPHLGAYIPGDQVCHSSVNPCACQQVTLK
jgi:hypothetical protein